MVNYSAKPQAGVGSRRLPAVLRNCRMLELIAGQSMSRLLDQAGIG